MTDDEAKARIDVLHDEALAILAEQGLSPVQAYCLLLERVTVRDEPTLQLLAATVAHDRWLRDEVRKGLKEADVPGTQWVSHDQEEAGWAKQREALQRRILLEREGKKKGTS